MPKRILMNFKPEKQTDLCRAIGLVDKKGKPKRQLMYLMVNRKVGVSEKCYKRMLELGYKEKDFIKQHTEWIYDNTQHTKQ